MKRLCARIARRRLHGTVAVAVATRTRMARYEAYGRRQHSGNETREDEDYLTHEDPRGAGGHT